jgi:hypothetical protein
MTTSPERRRTVKEDFELLVNADLPSGIERGIRRLAVVLSIVAVVLGIVASVVWIAPADPSHWKLAGNPLSMIPPTVVRGVVIGGGVAAMMWLFLFVAIWIARGFRVCKQ